MVNFNMGLYQSYLPQAFSSYFQNNGNSNILDFQNAYYPSQGAQEDPLSSIMSAIGALDNPSNYAMGLPFEQNNNYAMQPYAAAQAQPFPMDPFMMMMQMMMQMMQSMFQMMGFNTNNQALPYNQDNMFTNNNVADPFNTAANNPVANNPVANNPVQNPANAPPLDLANMQGTAFGKQVAQSAAQMASSMNSHGWCLRGVARALAPLGVSLSGASAYQVAGQMAASPKFKEVTVTRDQLKSLPPGAVVVWSQSAGSPHGHISVALGNGQEASDHIQNQITNLNGSTYRVFIPLG